MVSKVCEIAAFCDHFVQTTVQKTAIVFLLILECTGLCTECCCGAPNLILQKYVPRPRSLNFSVVWNLIYKHMYGYWLSHYTMTDICTNDLGFTFDSNAPEHKRQFCVTAMRLQFVSAYQTWTTKTLPKLMSLSLNSTKAQIYPALCQQLSVVMVWRIFSW